MTRELEIRAAQSAAKAVVSTLWTNEPFASQTANRQFEGIATATAIYSRLATEAFPELQSASYGAAFREMRDLMDKSKLTTDELKSCMASAASWAANKN